MADRCKSCGASIRWARTEKGKAMPLNPEPDPKGNVVLYADGTCRVLRNGVLLLPGQVGYTSHFVDCPNSKQHRKAAAK